MRNNFTSTHKHRHANCNHSSTVSGSAKPNMCGTFPQLCTKRHVKCANTNTHVLAKSIWHVCFRVCVCRFSYLKHFFIQNACTKHHNAFSVNYWVWASCQLACRLLLTVHNQCNTLLMDADCHSVPPTHTYIHLNKRPSPV